MAGGREVFSRKFLNFVIMVSELKSAVKKAEKLSSKDQKAVAKIILDELAWNHSLAVSQRQLSILAQEAKAEYKKGATKSLEL
jgi:acyl carrier protein phosphodiesterase